MKGCATAFSCLWDAEDTVGYRLDEVNRKQRSIEFDWETSQNESLCIINFMVKKQKMRDASFADPDEPKPSKRRRKANRGGRPRL